MLKDIGFGGGERKRCLKKVGEVAERASRSIWTWSRMKEWGQKWDPVAKAAGGARPGEPPRAAETQRNPARYDADIYLAIGR